MALDETGRRPSRQRDGFDGVFLKEWPRVVRVAQQITHSPSRSEEVAQEVFLAFYRRFGDELPEHAGAWLYRAAAHAALNDVRGEGRRRLREAREARMEDPSVPDPGELVAAREEVGTLRQALARLREAEATLLALRFSGLSYNEIAQTLDVPVSQIGTRLRRAELRLRKEMDHVARA
jgi:RNA polymerase sigma factor (sigma-70 family)